jgi:WD40 repeat protein
MALEGHTAGVTGVGFSPDGKILVSTASMYNFRTTIVELWLWDVESGKVLAKIDPKQFVTTCLVMAPDRNTFALGSLRGIVKIWSLATLKEIATLPQSGDVLGVAYSPDGKMLAVACGDPSVTIWDTTTGKEKATIPDLEEPIPSSVAYSPDGKFLAAALNDQTVKIWEGQPPKLSSTLRGHTNAVRVVAYSPVGMNLASGGKDGEVRLWDLSTGQARLTLK